MVGIFLAQKLLRREKNLKLLDPFRKEKYVTKSAQYGDSFICNYTVIFCIIILNF